MRGLIRSSLVVVTVLGVLSGGAVTANAFTLIAVSSVSVSPTSGIPTGSFNVDGKYKSSICTATPPSLVFTFLFDGIQIDQVTLSTCDTGTLTYDTGNRSVSPPAAKRNLGKHTVQLNVTSVTGGAAPNGTATTSYTLTWGKPTVTVSPTSGIPTAKFVIRGKFVWTGPCPSTRSPIVLTFKFYWYKVESTKSLLWTTTASTCASKTVDTGNSPQFIPPAPLNFPSTFVIQVLVYDSTGAPFGRAYGAPYTNTTLYRVLAAPSPSPVATPSTPCGQVGTAPCPSPTPTSCPAGATGMLPPAAGGRDAAVLVALVLFGTLPIGGLVMVMSPGAWNRRRWSQVLAVLGLSLILVTAGGCAAIVGQQNPTPTQGEPSPSPSPSPTC